LSISFFASYAAHLDLHSFPTRRSSDLTRLPALKRDYSMYTFPLEESEAATIEVRLLYRRAYQQLAEWKGWDDPDILMAQQTLQVDRKSTRLNSSHVKISYAVFCLKKKN